MMYVYQLEYFFVNLGNFFCKMELPLTYVHNYKDIRT